MADSTATMNNQGRGSWKPGISGFSAGMVSTMLLLPLDNIKVRLQVNEGTDPKNVTTMSMSTTTAAKSNRGTVTKGLYRHDARLGAMRMFRGVIKYEGVRGLYQGLVPAIVGSAVSWGGFFLVYEHMKHQLRHMKHKNTSYIGISENQNTRTKGKELQQEPVTLNSLDNFVLATASGIVMVFATNPIWLIKLRLQLQMKQASKHFDGKNIIRYDGFFDAFRKIIKSEGILGLYKGTGPALILTSHGGVQFVVYEFLRKHFNYARAKRTIESSLLKRFEDSLGYLTIGAISKM